MTALPPEMKPVFLDGSSNNSHNMSVPAGVDVHVWMIPVSDARDGLNKEEAQRAGRFHFSADADLYSTGRLALRRIAGTYLGIAASEVIISGGRHGKPEFNNEMLRPLHFNLSHSGLVVLLAFGEKPLGIDIERIDPSFDPKDILPYHFDDSERALIEAAPEKLPAFYQLWTRKEALLKAQGTGLMDELHQVPVLEDLHRAENTGETWRLISFSTIPGYAAALACNVSADRITFYRETPWA